MEASSKDESLDYVTDLRDKSELIIPNNADKLKKMFKTS